MNVLGLVHILVELSIVGLVLGDGNVRWCFRTFGKFCGAWGILSNV